MRHGAIGEYRESNIAFRVAPQQRSRVTKMAERSRGGEVASPMTPLFPFDFPAKTPAPGIPAHLRALDTSRHSHGLICRHQRRGGSGEESLPGGKKRGGKADSIARRSKEPPQG